MKQKPVMTVGRWSLHKTYQMVDQRSHAVFNVNEFCVAHDCIQGLTLKRLVWYYWRHFDIPCSRCGDFIPEELQTLFVLLTGDMTPRTSETLYKDLTQ